MSEEFWGQLDAQIKVCEQSRDEYLDLPWYRFWGKRRKWNRYSEEIDKLEAMNEQARRLVRAETPTT